MKHLIPFALYGVVFPLPASAQEFILSECDSHLEPGVSWVGQITAGTSQISIGGSANENGFLVLERSGTTNAAAFMDAQVTLTARLDAGHSADHLEIMLSTGRFDYHYQFDSSLFNLTTFTKAVGPSVNMPTYILDRDNGFALYSVGPSVPPNLSSITLVQIQGDFGGGSPFHATFDSLSLLSTVPEPEACAIPAAVALVAFAAWRRGHPSRNPGVPRRGA